MKKENGINALIIEFSLIDRWNNSNINSEELNKYILNKIQNIIKKVEENSTIISIEQIKEISIILKNHNILNKKRNEIAEILNNKISYEIYDDMDEYKSLKYLSENMNFNFTFEIKDNINNNYKEFIENEIERVKEVRDDWEIESLIDDSNLLSSFFDYDNSNMINELESIREEIGNEIETEEDDKFVQNENDISDKEIVDMFSRLTED